MVEANPAKTSQINTGDGAGEDFEDIVDGKFKFQYCALYLHSHARINFS